MASNLQIHANLKGSKITRALTKGIAQGAVLSGYAWNLGIDDIVEEANKGPTISVAYADDLFVMVTGFDPDMLVDIAQPTIDKITKMGLEKGLSFNSNKTVAVMFTNKKNQRLQMPKKKQYKNKFLQRCEIPRNIH